MDFRHVTMIQLGELTSHRKGLAPQYFEKKYQYLGMPNIGLYLAVKKKKKTLRCG